MAGADIAWDALPEVAAAALPAAGEVQCWSLELPRLAALAPRCAALLDDEEARRAARFHFERDRLRHVLAHGLLRRLIGQQLGRPPQALRFFTGAQGKPALAGEGAAADLRFNLSHSGDWLMLAFAVGHEVGIDVERHRPGLADELLPSLRFTAAERAWILGHGGAARDEAFFAAWSRKEAAIKAWGTGLSLELDRFDITPAAAAEAGAGLLPMALVAPPEIAAGARRWTIQDLPAPAGYSAALAVEQAAGGAAPRLRRLGHGTA